VSSQLTLIVKAFYQHLFKKYTFEDIGWEKHLIELTFHYLKQNGIQFGQVA